MKALNNLEWKKTNSKNSLDWDSLFKFCLIAKSQYVVFKRIEANLQVENAFKGTEVIVK